MITSINNQLLTLYPPSAMSDGGQARAATEAHESTRKTKSRKTESALPNGNSNPAGYSPHSRRSTGTDLQFRVDRNTDQIIITVRQKDTGEFIREIRMNEPFSLTRTVDATQTGQVFHAIA